MSIKMLGDRFSFKYFWMFTHLYECFSHKFQYIVLDGTATAHKNVIIFAVWTTLGFCFVFVAFKPFDESTGQKQSKTKRMSVKCAYTYELDRFLSHLSHNEIYFEFDRVPSFHFDWREFFALLPSFSTIQQQMWNNTHNARTEKKCAVHICCLPKRFCIIFALKIK